MHETVRIYSIFLALPLLAQVPQGPANLDFTEHKPGKPPARWGASWKDGYVPDVRRDGCKSGHACLQVTPPASAVPNSAGFLTQYFDASPYRGKVVRLRGWVKLEARGAAPRQAWLRVDGMGRGLAYSIAPLPSKAAEWSALEASVPVSPDGKAIMIGFELPNDSKLWIDGLQFDVVREASAAEITAAVPAPAPQTTNAPLRPPPQERPASVRYTILALVALFVAVLTLLAIPATRSWIARQTTQDLDPATPQWSLLSRVAFRLFFSAAILYAFTNAWYDVTPWIGAHLFQLRGDALVHKSTGSGDKALDFILALWVLVLAALTTIVWSVLDRHRKNYAWLNSWTRLLARYFMATALLDYGFAKVFPMQMPAPSLNRLLIPFGEFSPMGVAWTFIGVSKAYQMFSGAAEVLGGTLLLFRRTALLGALVSCAVLTNVVMLNLCYDIPVKLYSIELLFVAVYIAAPDAGRLVDVLLRNRAAAPGNVDPPPFRYRTTRLASAALKCVVILWLIEMTGVQSYFTYHERFEAIRPPLYGVFAVETFRRNGQFVYATDASRPMTIVCERPGSMLLITANGTRVSLDAEYDASARRIRLSQRGASQTDVLNYASSEEGEVRLDGTFLGDPVVINMRNSPLLGRRFHWINEYPVNR